MKQTGTVLLVLLLTMVLFYTVSFAAGNTPGDSRQTICPVMAGKIDKKIYADHKGKRIYFCCSSCLDDFKKDPDKYMKEMQEKGITPEKAP
ncbi:MAG: YHS domain-containing protein [Syntrophobacteraceae bacterium]